jgi:hypothetical protein
MILTLIAAAAALQPQTVVTVDPGHRLIEGVASAGKTIWLSSLIDRQILACRKQRCRTLATLPEGLHPFAIAWDSTRRQLWVAADCPPGVSFIKACMAGAVMAYDAKGKVKARIGPTVGDFHPGDVSAADGQVFASDSQNGMVYRLTPNGKALMAIVLPGVGKSGQGSAYDKANNRLIVADYSQGITAIDLKTNARTLLLRDNGRPLRGIDGLMRCGKGFVGVYNGQSPGQLIAFTIDTDKIALREAVEGYGMPDPTQVTTDGKRLLVVPNAGWEAAMKGPGPRTEGAPVVAFPMSAVCPAG